MKTLISIITLSLGLLCFAESRTVGELHDTNTVVTAESDPTVPDWAKAESPPQGMPTTGLVWSVTAGKVKTADGAKTIGAADVGALPSSYTPPAAPVQSVNNKTGAVVLSASDVHALPDTYTPPAAPVQSVNSKTGAVTLTAEDVGALPNTYTPPAAPVQSVNGKTGAVQLQASDVSAYPNASGVSLAQSIQVLGLHLQAEDARVTVTNYNSSTKDPSMYLEYKMTEGAEAGTWKIVWNELTRWNKLLDDILPSNYYNKSQVDSMVNNIPWGTWDSQTGGYAPDKTISMSADRVILCKGASYQRTVTAQGSYFVWTANQPYEVSGIESNGFFRIEDAEGNVTFEIVKGDKVDAVANPDGLYTENVLNITHLHIHYPIEADVHPTLEICDDLTAHDWKSESDGSCIANVTWTGTSGNYYAEVWGKTSKPQIFVRGTYQKGSDPYVKYGSALDVQQLRIGGVIYNVGTATISGHTVLTLTPAN